MKTPIHLVIGQEATSVGLLRRADRRRSALLQPSDARQLPGQRRRPAVDAVRDVLPRERLRRIARRIDAPDRQARRDGWHVGDCRRRDTDCDRSRARREDEAARRTRRSCSLARPPPRKAPRSESLNFAALKQLPLVFFCENNFYSVQSPLWTRQPPRVTAEVGRGLRAARGGGRWHERAGRLRSVARGGRAGAKRWRADVHRSGLLPVPRRMVDPATTPGPATATRTSGTRGMRSTRCRCTFSIWGRRPVEPTSDREAMRSEIIDGSRSRPSTSPPPVRIPSRPICIGMCTLSEVAGQPLHEGDAAHAVG